VRWQKLLKNCRAMEEEEEEKDKNMNIQIIIFWVLMPHSDVVVS